MQRGSRPKRSAPDDGRSEGSIDGGATSVVAASDQGAGDGEGAAAADDLGAVVAANLHRLRLKRGLSLERLAKASGVSKAMLGQIELSQSVPTIKTVWKIAAALGVPFAALIEHRAGVTSAVMRQRDAKVLTSRDGGFRSRALFPFDGPRATELYQLRVAPFAEERAVPHAPGTRETVVVHEGRLEIGVGKEVETLGPGDAITFVADRPHHYRNVSDVEVVAYLVMTYADATVTV